jgi:PPK2 family polyphosphate:nucleotide phosphotransferase
MEQQLRVASDFSLADHDTGSTPGWDRGKSAGARALAKGVLEIGDLQEKLFAESTTGSDRRVLLVLQGMDTSGKGGTVAHVLEAVDPHGLKVHAFKAPTAEEREHDFLWRVKAQLPQAGSLGVFDRSHYEDVLIQSVRKMAAPEVIEERYGAITAFESGLVKAGTTVIKVMLHLGPEEQNRRLLARLDRRDKRWKFNPGDVDERDLWPAYQEAYETAIRRTSTVDAPWYVVPADHKWYARLAVSDILLHHLRALAVDWPKVDYDLAEQRARLTAG